MGLTRRQLARERYLAEHPPPPPREVERAPGPAAKPRRTMIGFKRPSGRLPS